MPLSFKPIRPLLQTGTNAASRWLSYIGLGIGVLLLLCSIQMFVNIRQLLKSNTVKKGEYDYISVTKTVTNETMGQPDKNFIHDNEIEELKSKSYVADVAPLIATQFQLELSAPSVIPFETNLFLESIRSDFIDTVPADFTWQPGQSVIPMIISSEFLEIFNTLGPSHGYSQVSPETASLLPILIVCHGRNGETQTFRARMVGFTDRINSALVPLSFIEWANVTFAGKKADRYSRIYLKTKDANNTALLEFLDSKNYNVNKDKTKFGRAKQVFEGIFSALGIFGLLVVILALMLFSFYLQLLIARSRDSLHLLLTLGYSPSWLSNNVSGRFIPVYIIVVLIALAITQLMQWSFHQFVMYNRSELISIVNWSVIATAVLLILVSIITNHQLVKKLLLKLNYTN